MEDIKYSEFRVCEQTATLLRAYKKFDKVWSDVAKIINDIYGEGSKRGNEIYQLFSKVRNDIFSDVQDSIEEVTGYIDCPENVI